MIEIKKPRLNPIAVENEDSSILLFDGEKFSRIEPEDVTEKIKESVKL